MKNKKMIIMGVVVIFLLGILAFLLFSLLKKEKDDSYTGEPILQEALPVNQFGTIDVSTLQIDQGDKYKIWQTSEKVYVEEIEEMINKLGLYLPLQSSQEGSFYEWSDSEDNYFQYFLLRNSVVFNLKEGIISKETTLTANSFTNFVREFFDIEWDYEITEKVDFPDRRRFYYARRLTQDGWGIERTPNLFQETDYLAIKDGMIVSGEIFLTKFEDTGIEIPLLDKKSLSGYINNPNYPKIVNTRPDQIATALSLDEDYAYMDMEIIKLQDEIDNCKAVSHSVVYLYRSFEQSFLTPVYRLGLDCILKYEGSEYSVPSVAYVSALDPQYIAIPE